LPSLLVLWLNPSRVSVGAHSGACFQIQIAAFEDERRQGKCA
jgi:hypothetical protein